MAESRTLSELNSIPLWESLVGVYFRARTSHVIVAIGCSFAERGVESIVDTVTEKTGCGDFVDSATSRVVVAIKEYFPIIREDPEKIYKRSRSKATKYLKRGARSVFRSSAGKTFVSGIDSLTEAADGAYKCLKQHNNRRQKRKSGEVKSMSKSEKHVQTEMMSPTKTTRGQQTNLTGADDRWIKKLTCENDQRIQPVFSISYVLTLPLALFVRILKAIQRKLHSFSDKQTGSRQSSRLKSKEPSLTPEKVEEIEARRKVSPRKRLTIIRSIKNAAFKMLGFEGSCVRQTDIRQFLTCSKHKPLNLSPLMEGDDTEKKRKHDDILSDTEYDSDDEDLVNMDLKDYISEEDPDYEPTDEEQSDDTIESVEEEEESDFETVETEGLLQLKDKENKKPPESKQHELDRKPTEPKSNEPEKKPLDRQKVNEYTDKTKETKGKSPPKKSVLSPKKHSHTNVQSAVIINKSPVKPSIGKDDKKETKPEPPKQPDNRQTHPASGKQADNKQHQPSQVTGSVDKQANKQKP